MKAITCRTALALASMLVCMGTAQAEDLNFSELEARLAKIESQLAGQTGLQQAGYCCDACGDSGCCGCCDNGCCGCGDGCCGGGCCDCCSSCGCCGGYYAQVDLVFARAHLNEQVIGKLSEEYELAPRFILGYENGCGQGYRVRYWHYGHQSNNLAATAGVRFDLDLVDLELTNRFQFCRTDVTLAGGFRGGNLEIVNAGAAADIDLVGLTFAADVETLLCCDCCSYWSAVYGARTALLYGDWEGAGNALVVPNRDDNIVVNEIYAGVEYGCCYCGYDVYTQLKLELQNWHSDTLGENSATDSISFVGPTWSFGIGW